MSDTSFETLTDSAEPSRPFTDPGLNTRDFAGLEIARRELVALLATGGARAYTAAHRAPHYVDAPQSDHRIVLYHPDALRSAPALAFVGFCGFRAPDLPAALVDEITRLDEALLDELLAYPDVLSYSTLLAPDGDYVNLVVLRHLDAVATWRGSPVHKQAAEVLSPRYYKHVRIHNGVLPNGLVGALTATSTKYYDFGSDPAWRARRGNAA